MGAEFPGQISGHQPFLAPPSSRPTPTLLPHLEPWPFPPLSLLPPTYTGDPASRLLARPDLYPTLFFEILGALPNPTSCPGYPVSPLSPSGVPPHALLCTLAHGLTSSSLVVRKRPDLSNCRDSEELFPLHPEPWQPSPAAVTAVPSQTPAFCVLLPGLGSSLMLDSVSPLLCPRLNLSPPSPARILRTSSFSFLPPHEAPSSHRCCVRQRPHLSSPPPSPHAFPSLHGHLGDGGVSAAMSQRCPRGLNPGSAPPNLRPGQDAGLLSSFSPPANTLRIPNSNRGTKIPGKWLPRLSPRFPGQRSRRSPFGRTCSPAWRSWSAGDLCG